MLLDCTNTTSLFELGFGTNAVLAALSQRTNDARSYFLSKYLDALVQHSSSLKRKSIDRPEIHEILLGGLKHYALLIRLSVLLRAVAATMLVASIATLFQNALWGTSCKMEVTALAGYSVLAFLILPLAYYIYPRFLDFVTREAIAKTVPSATELSAALVENIELNDKMLANVQEQVSIGQRMSEAIHLEKPTSQLEQRMNSLQREIKSIEPRLKKSFANVKVAFDRATASKRNAG